MAPHSRRVSSGLALASSNTQKSSSTLVSNTARGEVPGVRSMQRMLGKLVESDDFERLAVRRRKEHRRSNARVQRLQPALGAHTPAVARPQAGELHFKTWRDEIVPLRSAEPQELVGDADTHRVRTPIAGPGVAVAVPIETGHR